MLCFRIVGLQVASCHLKLTLSACNLFPLPCCVWSGACCEFCQLCACCLGVFGQLLTKLGPCFVPLARPVNGRGVGCLTMNEMVVGYTWMLAQMRRCLCLHAGLTPEEAGLFTLHSCKATSLSFKLGPATWPTAGFARSTRSSSPAKWCGKEIWKWWCLAAPQLWVLSALCLLLGCVWTAVDKSWTLFCPTRRPCEWEGCGVFDYEWNGGGLYMNASTKSDAAYASMQAWLLKKRGFSHYAAARQLH